MESKYIPYNYQKVSSSTSVKQSEDFFETMDKRRSVRQYSNQEIPRSVIENIIKTASSAPSGAHKQPWTFCAISDPELKKEIRKAAEQEEYKNYHGRMGEEWLKDLEVLETE